ncbi:hypothetical protein C1646_763848 [Rhizophagus diaphanus]|nr:hypothetical protein C1646_763848 [Rhizophagus diaphanus] [Rhizophagus sp. MUCL 43196]
MVKTNYFGLNSIKLLKYNPKYFSKNGFIQMIERVYIDGKFKVKRCLFYIYCTVCDFLVIIYENTIECGNDYLKKCITKTTKMHLVYSNSIQKNVKRGVPSELSDNEINEIYSNIYFGYKKSSEFYCFHTSKKIKKSIAYQLINNAKVIQWVWRTYKLKPETWAKQV